MIQSLWLEWSSIPACPVRTHARMRRSNQPSHELAQEGKNRRLLFVNNV